MAKIEVLSPSVARKIAAGEVIEKPASVLRELLDNAIDSGATEVEIHLSEGGLKEIKVIDNGCGMSPEDLENSILPHATSKIHQAEDLYHLATLGFRGEALSSIAACSRLQITSKEAGQPGHKISSESGKIYESTPFAAADGTTVIVSDLFYSIPGRKKFMKSPQGEGTACLNVFYDKSAAFPTVAFRYFVENKLKFYLPVQSHLERLQMLYKERFDTQFLRSASSTQVTGEHSPISVELITTTPSIYKHDRKNIQIFVNQRRIQEFGLIQAIEYGYSEILPGGCFPISFAFIQIDPALVDFNIHPAKREVKFQDIQEVRQVIVQTLKNFLAPYIRQMHSISEIRPITPIETVDLDLDFTQTISEIKPTPSVSQISSVSQFSSNQQFSQTVSVPSFEMNTAKPEVTATMVAEETTPLDPPEAPSAYHLQPSLIPKEGENEPIRYLGQFQNLFLIATRGNNIYLIDQHAAHERLLFNQFSQVSVVEKLLIPLPIKDEAGKEAGLFTFQKIQNLKQVGIELKYDQNEGWAITSLPLTIYKFSDDLAQMIPDLPEDLFELRKRLFATLSCRSAIKEGDAIPDEFAKKIVEGALALDNPHCPHGRPIYFSLSMEELFQLVGRTI